MKKLILSICLFLFIAMPVYGQQSIPSYQQGFATRSLSKRPNLWRGLVGCWKPSLGVTGLTLRDVSGHGNHGALTNMTMDDWVISGNPRLPSYSLDFDGSNDYVEMATSEMVNSTEPFTINYWVFVLAVNDNDGMYSLVSDKSTGFISFFSNHASYRPFSFGSSTWLQMHPSTDFRSEMANAWTNISIDFDGVDYSNITSFKLYRNGIEEAITASGGYAGHGNLTRLGRAGSTSTYLDGQLDLFRVWTGRNLTTAETLDVYQHPNAMFEFTDRGIWKVPDVAPPSTRNRVHLISQYFNNLVEQCYRYN
jgi:hypothetical protein